MLGLFQRIPMPLTQTVREIIAEYTDLLIRYHENMEDHRNALKLLEELPAKYFHERDLLEFKMQELYETLCMLGLETTRERLHRYIYRTMQLQSLINMK